MTTNQPSTSGASSVESSLSTSAEPSTSTSIEPSTSASTELPSGAKKPRIHDVTARVHFLHQAANLLAQSTDVRSSSAAKLARLYLSDMKEVCFIGMTKVDRGIRRSYCKKCKQPWIGCDEGSAPFKLKLGKNRRLRQACRNCGTEKSYLVDRNYLSRNEQGAKQ